MILFAAPQMLWLLVPWVAAMWLFARVQWRALDWLEARVAPRFAGQFTVHRRASLAVHLVFLAAIGAVVIVAAAGPGLPGEAETSEARGRVLFLIDASASMFATDVEPVFLDLEPPGSRIELARQIALDLGERLEGARFALATYSGSAVIHLPMIGDRRLLEGSLRVLETHNYYRNTGSSLGSALDVVAHFLEGDGEPLQVVMLGDGELPRPEEYDDALRAVVERGVVVHAVAIGSEAGQGRLIYDFRDVVAKKEDPRVLREYTTRRVDRHLRTIAEATGGSFSLATLSAPAILAERIRLEAGRVETVTHEAARRDLAAPLLAAGLAGFLLDTLVIGRRRRRPVAFDLSRLGASPPSPRRFVRRDSRPLVLLSILGVLLVACAETPRKLAHRENERGIRQDAFRRHDAARPHYERSRAYDVESHIPVHNLARSVALTGDVSEAHALFQDALALEPELGEALFNDGVTLYLWGEAERDPENCDLERTRELWVQAAARFQSAARNAASEAELARRAETNRDFVRDELAEIRRLIDSPPEHCLSETPESEPGSGGATDTDGEDDEESPAGGGGDDDESEGGGNGEDESEGGGNGEDESGGDGGGEGEDDDGGGEGDDEDEGGGAGADDEGSGGDGPGEGESDGDGSLTSEELAQIEGLLEQIAARREEGGRFHRRTAPEQFGVETWSNPDEQIWW